MGAALDALNAYAVSGRSNQLLSLFTPKAQFLMLPIGRERESLGSFFARPIAEALRYDGLPRFHWRPSRENCLSPKLMFYLQRQTSFFRLLIVAP